MRSVVVLGMHRSGTSALTGALHSLGLELCHVSDLYTAPDNPEGHYESRTLIAANDLLLARRGGSWARPPLVGDAAFRETPLRVVSRLRRDFFRVHPNEGWLAKDPRLCLTLPTWLCVWREEPAVVLMLRHPDEVARSLMQRDGLPESVGRALWEWYVVNALRTSRQCSTTVMQHRHLVRAPEAALSDLAHELASFGVDVDTGRVTTAAATIRPSESRQQIPDEGTLWAEYAHLGGPVAPHAEIRDRPVSSQSIEVLRGLRRPIPVNWARRLRHELRSRPHP